MFPGCLKTDTATTNTMPMVTDMTTATVMIITTIIATKIITTKIMIIRVTGAITGRCVHLSDLPSRN
jgi:Na+/phosphate symporter